MATKTLLSNQTIAAPVISPSVTLAANVEYDATFNLNLPAGTAIRFSVQSSPDNIAWNDLFISDMIGASGINPKGGGDLSLPSVTCILSGVKGTQFRVNVLSVTGTVIVVSLIVSNTPL